MILSPPRRSARRGRNVMPWLTDRFSAAATDSPPRTARVKSHWATLPGGVVEGGEIVILAIKPSMWRLLFDATPLLVTCGLLAGVLIALGQPFPGLTPTGTAQLLMLLAFARLGVAIVRWIPTWYVLTNRRLIDIRGVRTPRIRSCPLINVRDTYLNASAAERMAQLGTITFVTERVEQPAFVWQSIAQPNLVFRRVQETIDNARDMRNLRG